LETVLIIAVRENDLMMAELLLMKNAKVDGDQLNITTPLHEAVTGGYVNMVILLMRYGADIMRTSPLYNGESPRHRVLEGRDENMRYLFGIHQTNRQEDIFGFSTQ